MFRENKVKAQKNHGKKFQISYPPLLVEPLIGDDAKDGGPGAV